MSLLALLTPVSVENGGPSSSGVLGWLAGVAMPAGCAGERWCQTNCALWFSQSFVARELVWHPALSSASCAPVDLIFWSRCVRLLCGHSQIFKIIKH